MRWIREGDSPEQIKISMVISAKEHPELAAFIWSLPYRGASKALRDILSSAVKSASSEGAATLVDTGSPRKEQIPCLPNLAGEGLSPPFRDDENDDGDGLGAGSGAGSGALASPVASPVSSPSIEQVSAHAASIISRFDQMFPS
jgi:hypothetical protein